MNKNIDYQGWDHGFEWQESSESIPYCILERSNDILVSLMHCWEYGSLIQDLIGIRDNKI